MMKRVEISEPGGPEVLVLRGSEDSRTETI